MREAGSPIAGIARAVQCSRARVYRYTEATEPSTETEPAKALSLTAFCRDLYADERPGLWRGVVESPGYAQANTTSPTSY
jgi:Helix-turn-helix domain of resolvase